RYSRLTYTTPGRLRPWAGPAHVAGWRGALRGTPGPRHGAHCVGGSRALAAFAPVRRDVPAQATPETALASHPYGQRHHGIGPAGLRATSATTRHRASSDHGTDSGLETARPSARA